MTAGVKGKEWIFALHSVQGQNDKKGSRDESRKAKNWIPHFVPNDIK